MAPANPLAPEAYAHGRFVDMFLAQNRRAQLGLLLAAGLVAWLCWGATGSWLAWAWLGLAISITCLRYLYTETWVRAAPTAEARTQRIVTVLVVNGLLMAAPLVGFERLSQVERAALSIILLATATASVATTSGFRSVFVAYTAPMLLPLALAWALVAQLDGSGAELGLAGLVVFFQLFLISVGQQAAAMFKEATQFRFGEQALNRQLALALEEAGEANRAKTQFLAAASHDLRQPIHSMNVLVAALGLRQLPPEARGIVDLLGTVNQSLSRQLETLLDMSKLDAGVVGVERSRLALAALLRSHHAATAPVAAELGLSLVLDLRPDADTLHADTDGTLLLRVLSNLTDNALKFTPAGGSVHLVLRREGDRALLQVRDSGIGIPANEQTRVFREFYQVGNVERDRLKGLGLGLSIVQRLCRLLGVELTLASTRGLGTEVGLRLPLCEADAETAGASALPSPARSVAPGLHVLVVDDEALVRQSMALLLQGLGCVVRLADTVEDAAALAAAGPVELVLCDLRLRGGDTGLDAIAAVRRHRPAAQAVLITGDIAPDRMQEARAAGIPLLYKPVQLSTLLDVLPASRPAAAS